MKNKIKEILYILSSILVLPLYIVYKIKILKFKTTSHILSLIPGKIGNYTREIFYRLTLKKVGENFRIDFGSYIVYPDIEIGNKVVIEEHCVISRCKINDYVVIAANVSIMSGKNHHPIDELDKRFIEHYFDLKGIEIGENVWIGTNSVIMNDVPKNSVVAAGSVLTKKFEGESILGGVPARLIRKRGIL